MIGLLIAVAVIVGGLVLAARRRSATPTGARDGDRQ
jgi:hypothetical protein